MCMAIPMKIVSFTGESDAVAECDGVRREVKLSLLSDEVGLGDYVIIHAGFAISKLNTEEAEETLAIMREVLEAGQP
ncbi:HypC/HybG/HupF family hydrogenase formation chaperone [Geomonas sp. RF6]|uniref:HypC/HybG/HupF family hydrogenase formation chaperone n=1 Tax=Geomonas sp. RF6 TaxID=2897342 RepID=UPI001E58BC6C|nr:HypC/HybG/HupF family hydrogenase formation chaperone [Geomonas sp. RF6]UFS70422.1 HypC/HybG/HupF family hydrogenase formation chaperone [Geomonas sp. RF6]